MFIGQDAFIRDLKSNPDQEAMIDELFRNPDFLRLWRYLENCRKQITLKATPGLTTPDGVERFGWYEPGTRTLELNPTKPEHQSNASELLDTLIHELIHALCDLRADCGEDQWPLPAGACDWYHDPQVTPVQPGKGDPDSPDKRHAERHYGDSASAPATEFSDMNDKAQELIEKIITSVLKATAGGEPFYRLHGGPTLTSKNLKKLRGSPHRITKNWRNIRAVTWEPDRCWRRTSTPRGWIMRCHCDWCQVIVKYNDRTIQIDLVDRGDQVVSDLDTLDVERLIGWDST